MSSESTVSPVRGIEHPHVIDIISEDAAANTVTLIMLEPRPWDGTELQMFQLQEKINAYLSFALDGEMFEAYPHFTTRSVRLQLDCATMPDNQVVGFLSMVRDQIAFQGIDLEVRVMGEGGCGPGCACHE